MSWRLLFSGTQSTAWMIAVISAVLLTLVLSVWLSRLERQLVSGSVGRTLLLLRLLVLATLLLAFLQPVLTEQFDTSSRGRVVVGIDASESMVTSDGHATDAEKLRWAQALGMLGNEQTTPLIDKWVAALEAGNEPDWLDSDNRNNTADVSELADGRRQQIKSVLDELGQMSRLEFIQRLLQSKPHELLNQINKVMPLEVRLFATKQANVSAEQLQKSLQGSRTELIPTGTDVIQLLSNVIAEEGGAQVRAVVLLSDGRQTANGDMNAEARRLGTLNVPVYSIPIGSRLPPRDLTLASVDLPETVFVKDKALVTATIGTSGFEGQELTIRLEKDGAVIDQQRVTPSGDSATVRFEIPTSEVGRFQYQLATAVQPGELREDNNTREISLNVVDNKARVLLVDGDARWEFRYLHNLLERDAQVEFTSVVFRQPHLNLLNETYIGRTMLSGEQLKEQLSKIDVLIVGDVLPEHFSPETWKLVEEAVASEGLTLLLVPGRRGMPHAFSDKSLSALLPLENSRQQFAEKLAATRPDREQSAFQLSLTADAEQLPMFQMAGEAATGQRGGFSQLPGHPWAYTGTPRQSATVWSYVTLPGDARFREPAILHQFYGFGQTIWMGIDSTWRWRRRAGDLYHHRFWGQLVRWSARNKAAAGNDQVRLTLSDSIIDESETVEVVARFNPRILSQLTDGTVEVIVSAVDDRARENQGTDTAASAQSPPIQPTEVKPPEASENSERKVILQASAEHPERFSARLPQLPTGSWNIQLRITDSQLQLTGRVASDLLVQPKLSDELANVSCNRDLLEQVAQLSGGQMIEPYNIAQLPELLRPQDQSTATISEYSLWDHWGLLLIFFGLLTGEWVVRKLNGLP